MAPFDGAECSFQRVYVLCIRTYNDEARGLACYRYKHEQQPVRMKESSMTLFVKLTSPTVNTVVTRTASSYVDLRQITRLPVQIRHKRCQSPLPWVLSNHAKATIVAFELVTRVIQSCGELLALLLDTGGHR